MVEGTPKPPCGVEGRLYYDASKRRVRGLVLCPFNDKAKGDESPILALVNSTSDWMRLNRPTRYYAERLVDGNGRVLRRARDGLALRTLRWWEDEENRDEDRIRRPR